MESSPLSKLNRKNVAGPAAHQGAPWRTAAPLSAPDSASRQNKPNLLSHAAMEVADALLRDAMKPKASGTSVAASLPSAPQGAPLRTAAHHGAPSFEKRKNEPNFLTLAQLAAVRALLAGRKLTAIAAELAIDRHTLLRWRRMPVFIAELQRQHDRLCAAISARR